MEAARGHAIRTIIRTGPRLLWAILLYDEPLGCRDLCPGSRRVPSARADKVTHGVGLGLAGTFGLVGEAQRVVGQL